MSDSKTLNRLTKEYASKGSGLSRDSPVVITCSSLEAAKHVINAFISLRHGEQGINWKRSAEFSLKSAGGTLYLRAIDVQLIGQTTQIRYYFDLQKPSIKSLALLQAIDPKAKKAFQLDPPNPEICGLNAWVISTPIIMLSIAPPL